MPNAGSFSKDGRKGGRPPGRKNNTTVEVRDAARRLVGDAEYRRSLRERLRNGNAGQMESVLWYYAYGKPSDKVELTGADGGPIGLAGLLLEVVEARDGSDR